MEQISMDLSLEFRRKKELNILNEFFFPPEQKNIKKKKP